MSDLSNFLMEQENYFKLNMFLVVFFNELSCRIIVFNFISKSSFLLYIIYFLTVLDRLLKVVLSEDSLDLCQREPALHFSKIKIFILEGKG